MNGLRLRVRENVLADPSWLTGERTLRAIREEGRGWVYQAEEGILGFSIALREPALIWALFVEPGHEGKGIGRRLLEMAVDWLWEQGAQSITLTTDPGTRAESFYRKAGWIEVGVEPNGEVRFRLAPAQPGS
jgi:GNAT superfamily N-acetyltransferase